MLHADRHRRTGWLVENVPISSLAKMGAGITAAIDLSRKATGALLPFKVPEILKDLKRHTFTVCNRS